MEIAVSKFGGDKESDYLNSNTSTPVKYLRTDLASSTQTTQASEPLSPVSSLLLDLGSLNLGEDGGNVSMSQPVSESGRSCAKSLRKEVLDTVETFSCTVANLLADSLPAGEVDNDTDILDWAQAGLLPHWDQLRRRVNNWRSDPAGRFRGLDFGVLVGHVVVETSRGLEMELGGHDTARCARMLDRLARLKIG